MLASEPINRRADEAAARLKRGLQDVLARLEIQGHIFGIASLVNVALGTQWDSDDEPGTAPHGKLSESTRFAQPLKRSMLNQGVDMLGGRGFLVSATHGEREVDQAVEAFEKAVTAMQNEGVV
jgi:glutamate-1-semialdehyde aminotransferase